MAADLQSATHVLNGDVIALRASRTGFETECGAALMRDAMERMARKVTLFKIMVARSLCRVNEDDRRDQLFCLSLE